MADLESKIRELIEEELAPAFDEKVDELFRDGDGYWWPPYLTAAIGSAWKPLDISVYAERETENSGRHLYTKSLNEDVLELLLDGHSDGEYNDRALEFANALEKLATDIRDAVSKTGDNNVHTNEA